MKDFKAVSLLASTVSLAVVLAVAATGPFSPTGSTFSNPKSEAPSAQGTITSEGIVLEWVKITAVGLGLLLVAWRIVKNTQLWRNLSLIVLGGECLAADEAGLAPDGLLDNLPNTDLELTIRPGATLNPPARGHGTPPASPSSMSPPAAMFARVSTWTSSSMSVHELHAFQPPFTRNG